MKDNIVSRLEKAYEVSKTHKFDIEEWENEQWEEIKKIPNTDQLKNTGIKITALKDLGEKITTLPEDWDFHP